MTAHVERFFSRRESSGRWPSVAVSTACTATLFALALDAMRSIRVWPGPEVEEPTPAATLVRLAPPPSVMPHAAPAEPLKSPQRRSADRGPAISPATSPALPIVAVPPVAAPIVAGSPIDSGTSIVNPPPRLAVSGRVVLERREVTRAGAPAGVTIHNNASASAWVRDSILRAQMAEIGGIPLTTDPPLGPDRRAFENGRQQATLLRRRMTSAGNAADVVMLQGNGVDGVGAVAYGLGQAPLPFLSRGPSRAQRRLNDSIDADYRARLGRLQERIRLKRDSLRYRAPSTTHSSANGSKPPTN